MKNNFNEIASDSSIYAAVDALEQNGISVMVIENAEEVKEKVFELIPQHAEVMNMTSVTLDSIGIAQEITTSENYTSVRAKLLDMDRNQKGYMNKLGAAPDWAIGSVHAVTETGISIIASATGSQLPAYAYGSQHVIWVVGAQKIVKDVQEGMRRIEEYVFPLENERAQKAYGVGSGINKILIINKEVTPGRITMIIVKEKLGF